VAAQRVLVLLFARDVVLAAQVFGRLQHAAVHRISIGARGHATAIEAVHQLDLTPVRPPARVGRIELGVAHAFHAAGKYDVRHARLHLHRCEAYRLQPGATAAIQLKARDLHRQAGVQRRQPPHGRSFPVWVAVPPNAVVHTGGRKPRTRQDLLNHQSRQGFGRNVAQAAAVAADGGAERHANHGVSHWASPLISGGGSVGLILGPTPRSVKTDRSLRGCYGRN